MFFLYLLKSEVRVSFKSLNVWFLWVAWFVCVLFVCERYDSTRTTNSLLNVLNTKALMILPGNGAKQFSIEKNQAVGLLKRWLLCNLLNQLVVANSTICNFKVFEDLTNLNLMLTYLIFLFPQYTSVPLGNILLRPQNVWAYGMREGAASELRQRPCRGFESHL